MNGRRQGKKKGGRPIMSATTVPAATGRPTDESPGGGLGGHPRGLTTLFLTEMWERFSYYGLRPLLVRFMSAALMQGGVGVERSQASANVGI
jgi:dipeptide/tripeptide permease